MTDLDLPPVGPPPAEERGRARGTDPGPTTVRTAVAAGRVILGPEAFRLLRDGRLPKGHALVGAEVAGVLAAKNTSRLLPFCRDVLLQHVELDFELDEAAHAVEIRAVTKAEGPTGVGMEALTAVTVAALTILDAAQSVTKDARIADVRLLAKSGGHSGDFRRAG